MAKTFEDCKPKIIEREFQACMLVLKQYRKLQAESAIKTMYGKYDG
jgi:hypothetical protein